MTGKIFKEFERLARLHGWSDAKINAVWFDALPNDFERCQQVFMHYIVELQNDPEHEKYVSSGRAKGWSDRKIQWVLGQALGQEWRCNPDNLLTNNIQLWGDTLLEVVTRETAFKLVREGLAVLINEQAIRQIGYPPEAQDVGNA